MIKKYEYQIRFADNDRVVYWGICMEPAIFTNKYTAANILALLRKQEPQENFLLWERELAQ